ncbi:hypothetical protein LEP1GSC172_2211 [Leptospira noguchii]|uniref:Uncharacterized protein n=2 Tax=Leptospira noguchii TaxID=28182 RepID=T0GRZ7_9LEPT|nr:hypothetical protein LEP1GSC172_2211 [Leptospira noguchii]EQA70151.1 hypothetical protein LEP1GSC059_4225 [Leptospira noguchii serovar Panama str. CZ214]
MIQETNTEIEFKKCLKNYITQRDLICGTTTKLRNDRSYHINRN